MDIYSYMLAKGKEYRNFHPLRAKNIYEKLSKYIPKKSKNIQIIGTNGKGSTGRFLALLLSDFKVLHFTSPHVFKFSERFYKNGKIISDEELNAAHVFLQKFDFIKDASYFEYATFLAHKLAHDVDYMILECGVGGERDSTSVLERDLCLFTMVDYDHCDLLGNSIEEIATTKLNAMISPSIIGIQNNIVVSDIAKKIAKDREISIHFVESICDSVHSYINKHKLATFLSQNLQLALKAMEVLNIKYNLDSIPKLDLPYRFQKIKDNIIVDVGHNVSAARAIKNELLNTRFNLIYNSYYQKDIEEILRILKDNIIKVEIIDIKDNDRIVEKDILVDILNRLEIPYCDFKSICDDDFYLVFGSFSVVENFMKVMGDS